MEMLCTFIKSFLIKLTTFSNSGLIYVYVLSVRLLFILEITSFSICVADLI